MCQYAKEQAKILPPNFEQNLEELFQNLFTDSEKAVQTIEKMIVELESIIVL